jgi:hypothetical protein
MARARPNSLAPSPHILVSIINKGHTMADMLAEFIDNSQDAKARNITIRFGQNAVIVTDDGVGTPHINDLFGLGHSGSTDDPEKIGRFGIGCNEAQLHFGSKVTVHSVHDDSYYFWTVDWQKAIDQNEWPEPYDNTEYVTESAPEAIREGGTRIVIEDLFTRPNSRMEIVAQKLAQRYLLGLRAGHRITLVDVRKGCATPYQLSPDIVTKSLNKGQEKTVEGEAAGLKFKVMMTTLKPDHDSDAPGVHFGFGHRFIIRAKKLGCTYLPGRLYAEVILSKRDWKPFLSANKTEIVQHKDELYAAVLEILKPLIAELEVQAESVRIELVNLALAEDLRNVLVFNEDVEGDKDQADEEVEVTGKRRRPGPPHPVRPRFKRRGVVDGGQHGESARKMRTTGISFARSDALPLTKVSSHEWKEGRLTILLNGNIPLIKLGYAERENRSILWPFIGNEFATFCVENRLELDKRLPGFLDGLNQQGWKLSAEYPDELRAGVFTYFVRQLQLDVEDRRKVTKLRPVASDEKKSA